MIRHGGLNQCPTRQFRPAAAANDLSDQAEHILIGAEPLPKKQGVDAQHTNQGDIAEIQALGNHLGAKQNIILLLGKTGQHFFVGVFLHGRILIHAQDPRTGQKLGQLLLHFLGTKTAVHDFAAAFRAKPWYRADPVPTVMAKQRVLRFMIDQRHGTVGALQHMAAGAAHANGLVAAAVQQQNALFPALQIGSEFLYHPLADFPRVPGGKFRRAYQ